MALKFIEKLKLKEDQAEKLKASESVECADESKLELQEKVSIYLVDNADKLKKWFSDSQLSEKLGKVAKKVGSTILYPVLLLYNLYKSPNTTAKDKLMIVAPLAYFILPVDLIPDAIVGLGFADDGVAIMAALKSLASSMTPELFEQTKAMHKNLIGEIDAKVADKVESEITRL